VHFALHCVVLLDCYLCYISLWYC